MQEFFKVFPGTPRGVRSSVRYGNTYRLDKAKEQYTLSPANIDDIILYVNAFLKIMGMPTAEEPKIVRPLSIDYKKIKQENGLASTKDIVWMKFLRSGHLGVVATSDDINFNIPQCKTDYERKKYNSSGILVHQLNESWNTSFVLIFPLVNIPNRYKRGDIEKAIGNYLIHKCVPIIDFYSHNY